MDSPHEGVDQKSVKISEAPNSKDHLDALFEVLVSRQDQPKTQGIPMIDRKFPKSFYDANAPDKSPGIRLGPSISVGPPPGPNEHLRSFSMPARMDHGRQYSDGLLGPLPSGWEAAKTPDGISYFIDHNTRATTWEDPRKSRQNRPSIQMPPPPGHSYQSMPPYTPQNQSHPMQQQFPQPLEASPLPEGWQKAFTAEGEVYYVNHKNRTTSWFHPSLPQHHHSHSYAPGTSARGMGMPSYSGFPQQSSLIQHQLQAEKRQQYDMQFQQNMASGSESRVPATLYSDPYLSSSHVRQASHDSGLHIRQASHDSGLGAPALPYQSEVMEFDEGMDMSAGGGPSNKASFGQGPPNRSLEYDNVNSLGVDTNLSESQHVNISNDQPIQEQQMDSDLDRLAWV